MKDRRRRRDYTGERWLAVVIGVSALLCAFMAWIVYETMKLIN